MNDRGLVEVPENAVRDEPIAFGLTGVQLGICGVAAAVANAIYNATGVRVRDYPMTLDKYLERLQALA